MLTEGFTCCCKNTAFPKLQSSIELHKYLIHINISSVPRLLSELHFSFSPLSLGVPVNTHGCFCRYSNVFICMLNYKYPHLQHWMCGVSVKGAVSSACQTSAGRISIEGWQPANPEDPRTQTFISALQQASCTSIWCHCDLLQNGASSALTVTGFRCCSGLLSFDLFSKLFF